MYCTLSFHIHWEEDIGKIQSCKYILIFIILSVFSKFIYKNEVECWLHDLLVFFFAQNLHLLCCVRWCRYGFLQEMFGHLSEMWHPVPPSPSSNYRWCSSAVTQIWLSGVSLQQFQNFEIIDTQSVFIKPNLLILILSFLHNQIISLLW